MIRISSSYSKKVPTDVQFSSQQYHAGIEIELPDTVAGDRDAMKEKLRSMYRLLKESVDEQIQAAGNGQHLHSQHQGRASGHGQQPGNNGGHDRRATKAQVRAIYAIASRAGQDVPTLARQHGVDSPEKLSLKQASQLIEQLKERIDA